MTKTELSRFKAILNARIIELEQLIRHRDGIRVERSTDQLEEIHQASERALAVCHLYRHFSHLRNVRGPSVVPKKAASGYARSVMTTSPRSVLSRCRGLNSVYGARKL